MKAGGGKAKGNQLENRVAKSLSLWLTEGRRPDVLERSPASGGKATSHRKRQAFYGNVAGDLIAVSEEGWLLINRFIVEIKHRKDILVPSLIYRSTNRDGLAGYWLKLSDECKEFKKLPMLVARQNNRPMLTGLCDEGVLILGCQSIILGTIYFDDYNLNLMLYDLFIETASPSGLGSTPRKTLPKRREVTKDGPGEIQDAGGVGHN